MTYSTGIYETIKNVETILSSQSLLEKQQQQKSTNQTNKQKINQKTDWPWLYLADTWESTYGPGLRVKMSGRGGEMAGAGLIKCFVKHLPSHMQTQSWGDRQMAS